MAARSLEQAIVAIRAGNHAEGGRLLRIALRSPDLTGPLRATALIWLAETQPQNAEKIRLYEQALRDDPGNAHARKRLAALQNAPPSPSALPEQRTRPQNPPERPQTPPQGYNPQPTQPATPPQPTQPAQPPEPPPPGDYRDYVAQDTAPSRYSLDHGDQSEPLTTEMMPAAPPSAVDYPPRQGQPNPYQPQPVSQPASDMVFYRTVQIVDGPNGPGTAFFVTQDGVLATSRFAVSASEMVLVELERGRQMQARVVRAFPELDLAFLETGLNVSQLMPVTSQPTLAPNVPIVAHSYTGRVMTGQRRATEADLKRDWFPTTISQPLDAGGNPVFDGRNYLVGMLTRNANRTSAFVFGVHIHAILRCLERYEQEKRDNIQRVYCTSCGYPSRAHASGGFYCEMCGSVLPTARDAPRYPLPSPQLEALYGEERARPCPNCGSRVGDYGGFCLRCGFDMRSQSPPPYRR